MSDMQNLLVGLAMGLNLIGLASSRLTSLIRAAAVQGIVLGVLPLLLGHGTDWWVVLIALATVVVKGFLIPALLRNAVRRARIDREIEPVISFMASLLLGATATVGALALARVLPLRPEHEHTLLVPGAFATVISGLLLLMGRAKAISQVCGYLMLENGIYLFGMLLISSTPLLVEAGILLDFTVAIFVVGIMVDRIQREFDSLDTRRLTELHE